MSTAGYLKQRVRTISSFLYSIKRRTKQYLKWLWAHLTRMDSKKFKNPVKPPQIISPSEDSFYSLNKDQLQNLVGKNIQFRFFQLEKFSYHNKEIAFLLKNAQAKTQKDCLSELKDQDLKQPLVLICQNGRASKKFAQELRDKGFINAYFIHKGLKGLLEL